jgi:hypothetical protein
LIPRASIPLRPWPLSRPGVAILSIRDDLRRGYELRDQRGERLFMHSSGGAIFQTGVQIIQLSL